ncbi:MAG: FMN-binding protein [Marinilabiliaceae bacterium]|nr:FMN-binding protein [Marinilabiliaceae bacterium]
MKQLVKWAAYISLLVAFVVGQLSHFHSDEVRLKELSKGRDLERIGITDELYAIKESDTLKRYLCIGQAQGYGGPLRVAVLADSVGTIRQVDLLQHVETFSFIEKLKRNNYFRQYTGKTLVDTFTIHQDVNAVSGATISSKAIANATREASYLTAEKALGKVAPVIPTQWQMAGKELLVMAIFIIGFLATFLRNKVLRNVALFLSFIGIGFLFNASLTLAHFGRLLLGYVPDIQDHLVWWILMGGSLLTIVIWGKNVYCHAFCPFHATQMLLNKISGINLKMAFKVLRIIRKVPGFLLWFSLSLILISSNPTIAAYEPFAMLFSLEGYGVQWYILPAALVASLFISDFFCHYLCPVGATFKWIQKHRRRLIALVNKSQNEQNQNEQEKNKERKAA